MKFNKFHMNMFSVFYVCVWGGELFCFYRFSRRKANVYSYLLSLVDVARGQMIGAPNENQTYSVGNE